MADPGFPIGGRGPRTGGRGPPKWLRFENFACQNERIWTRRGGAPGARPPRSANGECCHCAVSAGSTFEGFLNFDWIWNIRQNRQEN